MIVAGAELEKAGTLSEAWHGWMLSYSPLPNDNYVPQNSKQPPDREFAQVKQGVGRSEGNAVIAADIGRQAALLKKPLKHGM